MNRPLLFTSANLHSGASLAIVQVTRPLCSCLINNSSLAVAAIFLAVSRQQYSVRADIVNHVRLPGVDNRFGPMPITNPIATRRVCGARYGIGSFVSHVTDHVIEHRPHISALSFAVFRAIFCNAHNLKKTAKCVSDALFSLRCRASCLNTELEVE